MCEELELLRCAEAEAIARHNRLMRLMRECGLGGPVGTEEAAQWFILKEGTDAALRHPIFRAKHPDQGKRMTSVGRYEGHRLLPLRGGGLETWV